MFGETCDIHPNVQHCTGAEIREDTAGHDIEGLKRLLKFLFGNHRCPSLISISPESTTRQPRLSTKAGPRNGRDMTDESGQPWLQIDYAFVPAESHSGGRSP